MKTKKEKSIVVSHSKAGPKFSPGNPSLMINPGFKDAERFSPRLAKFWAKVVKAGRGGLKVAGLHYDDQWSARFLIGIKALRDVPDPEAKKSSGKDLTIAKAARRKTAKNPLAKAA